MTEVNIDRARSAFQRMTDAKLEKACKRFGIDTKPGGRRMTRKQKAAALMMDDMAVAEYGRKNAD